MSPIKKLIFGLLILTVGLTGLVGCQYSAHPYMQNVRTIAVEIFDNKTLRRNHEFELTHRLERELKAKTPFILVKPDARPDLLLTGEIIDYVKPALVEDIDDRVIESQVVITIKVSLRDLKTNNLVFEKTHSENAELVGSRGENEITARSEVYEKLTRWTVSQLETRPK